MLGVEGEDGQILRRFKKKKINGIGVKLDQGILRLTSKSHKVLSDVSGK